MRSEFYHAVKYCNCLLKNEVYVKGNTPFTIDIAGYRSTGFENEQLCNPETVKTAFPHISCNLSSRRSGESNRISNGCAAMNPRQSFPI